MYLIPFFIFGLMGRSCSFLLISPSLLHLLLFSVFSFALYQLLGLLACFDCLVSLSLSDSSATTALLLFWISFSSVLHFCLVHILFTSLRSFKLESSVCWPRFGTIGLRQYIRVFNWVAEVLLLHPGDLFNVPEDLASSRDL